MKEFVRIADSKGRISLPGLANATVIIEMVDETEFRVKKAKVIPEKDLRFPEESFPIELSARDAAAVMDALENPPDPNPAARRAAKRFLKRRG